MSNLILINDWPHCTLHNRSMSYPEWKSNACFWCNPEVAPENSPVHKLNFEEKELLKQNKYHYSSKKSEEAHTTGKTKGKKRIK